MTFGMLPCYNAKNWKNLLSNFLRFLVPVLNYSNSNLLKCNCIFWSQYWLEYSLPSYFVNEKLILLSILWMQYSLFGAMLDTRLAINQ